MKQAIPADSTTREITAADRAARFSSTSKSELYTQASVFSFYEA